MDTIRSTISAAQQPNTTHTGTQDLERQLAAKKAELARAYETSDFNLARRLEGSVNSLKKKLDKSKGQPANVAPVSYGSVHDVTTKVEQPKQPVAPLIAPMVADNANKPLVGRKAVARVKQEDLPENTGEAIKQLLSNLADAEERYDTLYQKNPNAYGLAKIEREYNQCKEILMGVFTDDSRDPDVRLRYLPQIAGCHQEGDRFIVANNDLRQVWIKLLKNGNIDVQKRFESFCSLQDIGALSDEECKAFEDLFSPLLSKALLDGEIKSLSGIRVNKERATLLLGLMNGIAKDCGDWSGMEWVLHLDSDIILQSGQSIYLKVLWDKLSVCGHCDGVDVSILEKFDPKQVEAFFKNAKTDRLKSKEFSKAIVSGVFYLILKCIKESIKEINVLSFSDLDDFDKLYDLVNLLKCEKDLYLDGLLYLSQQILRWNVLYRPGCEVLNEVLYLLSENGTVDQIQAFEKALIGKVSRKFEDHSTSAEYEFFAADDHDCKTPLELVSSLKKRQWMHAFNDKRVFFSFDSHECVSLVLRFACLFDLSLDFLTLLFNYNYGYRRARIKASDPGHVFMANVMGTEIDTMQYSFSTNTLLSHVISCLPREKREKILNDYKDSPFCIGLKEELQKVLMGHVFSLSNGYWGKSFFTKKNINFYCLPNINGKDSAELYETNLEGSFSSYMIEQLRRMVASWCQGVAIESAVERKFGGHYEVSEYTKMYPGVIDPQFIQKELDELLALGEGVAYISEFYMRENRKDLDVLGNLGAVYEAKIQALVDQVSQRLVDEKPVMIPLCAPIRHAYTLYIYKNEVSLHGVANNRKFLIMHLKDKASDVFDKELIEQLITNPAFVKHFLEAVGAPHPEYVSYETDIQLQLVDRVDLKCENIKKSFKLSQKSQIGKHFKHGQAVGNCTFKSNQSVIRRYLYNLLNKKGFLDRQPTNTSPMEHKMARCHYKQLVGNMNRYMEQYVLSEYKHSATGQGDKDTLRSNLIIAGTTLLENGRFGGSLGSPGWGSNTVPSNKGMIKYSRDY